MVFALAQTSDSPFVSSPTLPQHWTGRDRTCIKPNLNKTQICIFPQNLIINKHLPTMLLICFIRLSLFHRHRGPACSASQCKYGLTRRSKLQCNVKCGGSFTGAVKAGGYYKSVLNFLHNGESTENFAISSNCDKKYWNHGTSSVTQVLPKSGLCGSLLNGPFSAKWQHRLSSHNLVSMKS